MTPLAALQTATVNPRRFLRIADTGEVKMGYRADLVLLNANPLNDIRNARDIAGVVAKGRYIPHAALQAMLVRAANLARKR